MKMKHIFNAILILTLWGMLALFAWFKPADTHSVAERRPLKQMPEFTVDKFLDGSFAKEFEAYSLDQFPMRDDFRQIKSMFSYYGIWQCDNNGIYVHDGYVEKLDYPLNTQAVDKAVTVFDYVYNTHLKGKTDNIYFAVVPDKGYYLTPENGYPAMDYQALMDRANPGWAQRIDLTGVLTVEDYYRTDTHWRQEALIPAAQALAQAMGQKGPTDSYTPKAVERPFYGVYYGQAALPMKPDTMYVMESPILSQVTVTGYDEMAKAIQLPLYVENVGDDLYDTFMEGSKQTLLVLQNPNARTDRELVIFRDSFGCSIAPLLLEDYAKITLVDLRYFNLASLAAVRCKDADVLFLYSTLVLNNADSFPTITVKEQA